MVIKKTTTPAMAMVVTKATNVALPIRTVRATPTTTTGITSAARTPTEDFVVM